MFFLHPKQEKEEESRAVFNQFKKYLAIWAAAIAVMRAFPYVVEAIKKRN